MLAWLLRRFISSARKSAAAKSDFLTRHGQTQSPPGASRTGFFYAGLKGQGLPTLH
ncbi:hypothetical protein AmDm5_0220 [Acetobacter malorum]|nr:hypothetical protein AmDm5_0220 [Acetobacter malorum]